MRHAPAILGVVLVTAVLAWQATSRTASKVPEAPLLSTGDDSLAFPPLPEPGPSDWLANHPEEGQSLEEFRAADRREVTAGRRTLRLQPLDDVARMGVDVATLAEHLHLYYGLPATAAPIETVPGLVFRTNQHTGRRQILTTDVLHRLEAQIPDDLLCILAVTTEDLYPEDSWNYVFGQASLASGVGVFSFARMDPAFPDPPPEPASRTPEERALVLRRCLKVVTHEVGHVLGIHHCIERLCLMNGSNHVAEMDRSPLHLCPSCLAKARHATGFDPAVRHAALLAFYRRVGLEPEARWVEARIARAPR